MDWWQTLVGTALLGTERQSPEIPTAPDPSTEDTRLAASLQNLEWNNPTQSLLGSAGAVALYYQVGQRPQTKLWDPLKSCPEDDLPCCSAQIGRYVNRCWDEDVDVLPELLTLIAQQNQRVPEILLPDLLDLGARHTALRPSILAVLGSRGQWLAAQNQAWEYGTGITLSTTDFQSDALQQLWKTGRRGERISLLSQWRAEDANGARDALEQVWAGELAKDREAFLRTLTPHLSMMDELFLEQVLDDRAKGVRKEAIALLRQLPDSQLCQRMAQRITPYLQIHHYPQNPLIIEVVLPEDYDPTWDRDGIVQLQPNPQASKKQSQQQAKQQGKRAEWLCQLLASTPLRTWIPFGEDAKMNADLTSLDRIMQATDGHPWQDVLLKGWAIATQRQHNATWANTLLHHVEMKHWHAIDPQLYPALRALLTREQQEELLTQQRPTPTHDGCLPWLQQVAHRDSFPYHPSWSLKFSHLVWQTISQFVQAHTRQTKQARSPRFYQWFAVIKDLGLTLHPAIAPDVAKELESLTFSSRFNQWERSLANFYRRLNFRYAIHQAFSQQ